MHPDNASGHSDDRLIELRPGRHGRSTSAARRSTSFLNWAALAKPKVPVSGGAYTEASVGPAVHSTGGGGELGKADSWIRRPPPRGDAQLGILADYPPG
ncbi:hypothetical protein MASSI9I_10004 [Massilia sp. 9I]|nr:hypothetical protein MASSI9I_10004 [Massilia sp. 9I]